MPEKRPDKKPKVAITSKKQLPPLSFKKWDAFLSRTRELPGVALVSCAISHIFTIIQIKLLIQSFLFISPGFFILCGFTIFLEFFAKKSSGLSNGCTMLKQCSIVLQTSIKSISIISSQKTWNSSKLNQLFEYLEPLKDRTYFGLD